MRNKLLTFLLLFFVFVWTNGTNFAQKLECASPEIWAKTLQDAPEQLQIKVLSIKVKHTSERHAIPRSSFPNLPPVLEADIVSITARIIEVKQSKEHLQKGDVIKIYYTTNQNYHVGEPKIWEAISPPMPEAKKNYIAYLQKVQLYSPNDKDDGYRYVPVAYSKSFEKMNEDATNK